MAGSNPGPFQPSAPAQVSPGEATRRLMRRALKASLATLDAGSGHPYASLVTIATDVDGTPLFLISTLALHTKNILKDARVALLFDGTDGSGDPLAGGRVTVMGRAVKTQRPTAAARFLRRHEAARGYAGFPDFAFYELVPERAHYIGGFGRIVDLAPADFMTDTAGAEALIAAHDDILTHMNDDHAAAIELYATQIAGEPTGPWRLAGVDPDGFDLACDNLTARIPFETRVTTPNDARLAFVHLASVARDRKSKA